MTWWEKITSVFRAAESSSVTTPVSHEVLERHRTKGEAYASWKKGVVLGRWKSWLADQYAIFLTRKTDLDQAIDFLKTPSKNGFVIHFSDTGYSTEESEFLQLYLRDCIMQKAYRTQIADTKLYTKHNTTERLDRYYLKPKPSWQHPDGPTAPMDQHTAGQFDQQFGNIMIELLIRNNAPYQLKFSATIYHDRIYKNADSFGALMDVVLR